MSLGTSCNFFYVDEPTKIAATVHLRLAAFRARFLAAQDMHVARSPMKKLLTPVDFIESYAPYLINQVANEWNYEFKKVFKVQRTINLSQWRVLAVLGAKPDLSLKELGGLVRMDQPTLSRIVERLVEQEFVIKTQAPSDRRYLTLSLSPQGSALVEEFWPHVISVYEHATSGLTPEEVQQLVGLLRKLILSLKPDVYGTQTDTSAHR